MLADAELEAIEPDPPHGHSLTTPKRSPSSSLFGNARMVLIEHENATYTLRKTRNGKLHLTK